MDELCPLDRVGLEASAVVVGEGLSQVALARRRVSGSEAFHEPGKGSRIVGRRRGPSSTSNRANSRPISAKTRRFPRAMAALARSSAAAGSMTSQTEASGSIGRDARAVPLSLHLHVACGLDRGRRRSECLVQAALEILLPDRASGLLRGPRRVGTPVGERTKARRRGRRQVVICLRDPEVADHGIGYCGDPIDVVRSQGARGGQRARHGLPV